MRRFGLLFLALVLLSTAACSEDDGGTASAGYENVTIQQAVTRVCGADRYTGVQGADVSKYQANFNWEAQKNAGMTFGIARISDGVNTPDEYFDRNWAELKRLGMIRGAYQYFRPAQNVAQQANMVVNKLGRLGPGDLPAVIDVESNGGLSKAQVAAAVKQWLQIVEDGTGKRPIIYTGPYFWQDNVGDASLGNYPLWIAHYGTTCPLIPDGWDKWTFWQYCDGNTQYCANGQGFDRNVYNGPAGDLAALAGGGGADYGATYVYQTFPLAAMAIPMVSNETLTGYIELRNTGSATWDANTKLGTTEPRDRPSALADDSWPAPNRAAVVNGTVAPGETYRFEFTIRAPSEPGVYAEYFNLVQEGVAWFSDGGQAGPADDQLQIKVEVTVADYQAELVDMSFADEVALTVGGVSDGWIELKNVGQQPWLPNEVFLAPTPRDQASPLHDDSWSSPTRVSTPSAAVPPGSSYKFPVVLRGKTQGSYLQTFGVVKEGETWFSESPAGGGPADDALAVNVTVGNGSVPNPNNTNQGTNNAPDGDFPKLIDNATTGTSGGCAQAGGNDFAWLGLLAGLVWLRRR
ncbi:MAG: GH25 family lysozyme [bacterium]